MPVAQLDTVAGTSNPWVPAIKRSMALKRDSLNSELVGNYTGTIHALAESDWVYLQAVIYAEQIHPYTVNQIAALGAIDGRDAARWTMEGPTFVRPGEPLNTTMKLEVAHSLTATPGTDWREFRAGMFKLRSYRMKLTITRSSLDFDFRVYRLATRATRRAPPQRDASSERFFAHG